MYFNCTNLSNLFNLYSLTLHNYTVCDRKIIFHYEREAIGGKFYNFKIVIRAILYKFSVYFVWTTAFDLIQLNLIIMSTQS